MELARQLRLSIVSETPITPEAVAAATAAALAAIASAPTVSDLKTARAEHSGEQSALAQFNAAIKGLPGSEKAAAGKLVGEARGAVNRAVAAREAELAVAEEQARLACQSRAGYGNHRREQDREPK